jgi:ATP-dependent DNA helicase RecQ
MVEPSRALLTRCVAIDLEVDPKTASIFDFAAVWCGGDRVIRSQKRHVEAALDQFEAALTEAEFLIGHNILRHDLPHLAAARPRLVRLANAPIDTLWLNPLAFPRNPYHRLIKHYHDGRLQSGHVSDPALDARLVFEVLENQLEALTSLNGGSSDLLTAFHFLTTRGERTGGIDLVFRHVRDAGVPTAGEAETSVKRLLQDKACTKGIDVVCEHQASPNHGWPLAYALSWISVAGGDSVMPPWVRRQFPEAARIVRNLRDTNCNDGSCTWCRGRRDPVLALSRWFGYQAFRPRPTDDAGRSLQQRIVEEALGGRSLLAILPTGTGKSVCYQIPALSKFEQTGALSVVISPLVALMADQVQGMERAGISSAVTVNGMLSMTERQAALDRVRMGEAAMLLISPEQLRSVSVRSTLAQREVGLWALDEAHCISKWGHDFRPDYRYVSRFIREFSGDEPPAPILCLTATAKPEVARDIREHFRARLGADLLLLDGGAARTNLRFSVQATQPVTKLADILAVIGDKLPAEGFSGAIIYCATRGGTERVATFLKQQGLQAEHFHAGLKPDEKREVQERFRSGDLRVIAATNAFGMGIDKPDVRLVVHGDIPGSLENYLQEAGRAGRDQASAHCVLLFSADDVERQFSLSARSRLARHEIGAILKALRRLAERTRKNQEIIATTGEIVRAERNLDFARDSNTDDTRVKTAVSWLEEASLLTREENRVSVFPSSLRIRRLEDADEVLAKSNITGTRRTQLRDILRCLINAAADQGITTDELAGVSGLTGGKLNQALADLEALGLLRNDMAATFFVHVGVEGHSQQRLAVATRLETDLINAMRELAPNAEDAGEQPLHLTSACETLREAGHAQVRPDLVERLLRAMALDGRDRDGGQGLIRIRKVTRNTLMVTLQRAWSVLDETVAQRRVAMELLLNHVVGRVPKGVRGKDIQVDTTIGELRSALSSDALLRNAVPDVSKLLSRSLLWLHGQEVLTLGRGMTVFRPAMSIHLKPGREAFTQKDFVPLDDHYAEQTLQTHVMSVYAEVGLASIERARQLTEDYFVLDRDAFLRRWLAGRGPEIRRQTTSASWKAIVDALINPVQQKIVTDDREQTNVLVVAGPGSGKTRALVHRIAYLVRVRREDPQGILVLCYNRHAAAEIRTRLRELIGDDAIGVTVLTCHAFAMRLIGASFSGTADATAFDSIVMDAVRLLNGEGLTRPEVEAQREALIPGYRWILVDEYQDIGAEEYALIAAIAGRSLEDPDLRLSLFAVGDDDQNIYAFSGASIRYIRQFEADYRAKPEFLVENYRSTGHIIDAANAVIAGATSRMKAGHDIVVDRRRTNAPPGGALADSDPVAHGRVQVLLCPTGDGAQAVAALDELVRLSRLVPGWDWSRTAIIARKWDQLSPVRAYAEMLGIPVEVANDALPNLWRLREMQTLVAHVKQEPAQLFTAGLLADTAARLLSSNHWTDLIREGIDEFARDVGDKELPVPDVVEWLAEWARDTRGRQQGLLLLSAHRAKGLEFDHVVILDGNWEALSKGEDEDAPRRLFYVAMTRARESLIAMSQRDRHPFIFSGSAVLTRRISPDHVPPDLNRRVYLAASMRDVDLSYAGRLGDRNPALAAIANARTGDPLALVREADQWKLLMPGGQVVGRMARSWDPPPGRSFVGGKIAAIVQWRRVDNDQIHGHVLQRDLWETVLPELVFQ